MYYQPGTQLPFSSLLTGRFAFGGTNITASSTVVVAILGPCDIPLIHGEDATCHRNGVNRDAGDHRQMIRRQCPMQVQGAEFGINTGEVAQEIAGQDTAT